MNLVNSKVYIGKSIHIFQRWREHTRYSKYKNTTLYRAMCKYGIENFKLYILKETEESKLNYLENCYIQQYQSNCAEFGYNMTNGGDGGPKMLNDKNPNSKLSVEDVIYIRNAYNFRKNKMDVYEQYKNIITINTFNDVWQGKTWRNILPEVYTEENIKFHSENYDKMSSKNNIRVVSDEEILFIRNEKNKGILTRKQVKELFPHINENTFYDIWTEKTFKHIVSSIENNNIKYKRIPREQSGDKNPCAKLTNKQVFEIRRRRNLGEKPMDVYIDYQSIITRSGFYKVWNNETYKGV